MFRLFGLAAVVAIAAAAAAQPPAPGTSPHPLAPHPAGAKPTVVLQGFAGLAGDPNRGDGPSAAAFLPAGDRLATTTRGGKMNVFNPSGASMGPGFGPPSGGYGAQVGLAAHPAQPWVLTLAYQQHPRNGTRVVVWDPATGKQVRDLDEGAATAWLSNPVFDPAGKTVWLWEWYYRPQGVIRQGQPDTMLRVWDAETGDEVRAVVAPAELPEAAVPDMYGGQQETHILAFAPSGAWAAVVHGRRVCLIEAATGQLRADLGQLPARLPPADPNQPRGRPNVASGADAVAVSGDGRQVLVGCRDMAVRRWDVLTGRELPPLIGHRDAVKAVWCSADGRTARSVSSDTLLTWDLKAAGWTPPADPPAADALAALFDQLGADDPAARYAAEQTLAAHPGPAVRAVAERIRPVPAADKDKLAGLVKDLHGADYNARKRAMRELREVGEPALAALGEGTDHRVRFGEGPAAVLVKDIKDKLDPAAAARAVRAVGVLERVGGPDAGKLLGELAAGAPGAVLTRVATEAAERAKARGVAAPADLPGLWAALAGDPAKAFAAIRALAAKPAEAVPLLREKLAASPGRLAPDLARVPGLVAALGADDFAEREAATKELAGFGTAAVPALRAAAPGAATPEAQRRLADLLKNPADPATRPDALQAARAVEVLELIGTADARAALDAAADGATAEVFREAVAGAARRLGKGR